MLQNTSILAKRPRCREWIIKEAREIELHPMNMNREDSFSLSTSWKPLVETLKECKKAVLKENRLGLEKGSFFSSLFDLEEGSLLLCLLCLHKGSCCLFFCSLQKGSLFLVLLFPANGQFLCFHPCPVKVDL
jgi:hypothetical protein